MSYNPFSLEGKTILITGASSGIGRATAIECSKMGAKCVITGRDQERLQETFDQLEGEGHLQIIAELTNPDDVKNIIESAPELQGVVLCAGKGLTLPILFSSSEKMKELYDINLFAPIELFRLLVKKKKIATKSSVVFVVSIGGTKRFSPGNSIYGTAKAALKSAVNFFAIELGHKLIRVNGISPGMVETPLIHGGSLTTEQLEEDCKKYPLGRYGQPIDIALPIAFLLSDASSWMTGHTMVIDGGITAK